MFWTKAILVLCLAAFFAQSGDVPPIPVTKQAEELALKARREGQAGPRIPIPPDLFAKVTETISAYPTICDAPHRASLHAYRLPYEYKGSDTFAIQGRGYLLLLLGRELPILDLSQAPEQIQKALRSG
jgi:hypothetical protein